MADPVKISVVIPVFNEVKTIGEVINRVLNCGFETEESPRRTERNSYASPRCFHPNMLAASGKEDFRLYHSTVTKTGS